MRLIQESWLLSANTLIQSLTSLSPQAPSPPSFCPSLSFTFIFALLAAHYSSSRKRCRIIHVDLCRTARTHNLPQRGCAVRAASSSSIDLVSWLMTLWKGCRLDTELSWCELWHIVLACIPGFCCLLQPDFLYIYSVSFLLPLQPVSWLRYWPSPSGKDSA